MYPKPVCRANNSAKISRIIDSIEKNNRLGIHHIIKRCFIHSNNGHDTGKCFGLLYTLSLSLICSFNRNICLFCIADNTSHVTIYRTFLYNNELHFCMIESFLHTLFSFYHKQAVFFSKFFLTQFSE
ncbi:MAG: hypothetical protein ACD_48C00342G0001 [uncultured bacterium]|nr:MAG: hypothetical protein ACD_48C00342G0001 [uncultured bacterium]